MNNKSYDVTSLSNHQLLTNTLSLVKKERGYVLTIITHLEEIESRRLYCKLGFPSMFAYVTKSLGYSENDAHSRIACMRLSRTNPEIKDKLAEGKLSLTNIGFAVSSIKRQEDAKGEKFSAEEKSKVLEAITNKTTGDAKIKLEAMEGSVATKKIIYKVEISEYGLQLMRELQATMGNYQDAELLELLISEKIQSLAQQEKEKQAQGQTSKTKPSKAPAKKIIKDDNSKKPSRYISKKVKEDVLKRSGGRCEYVSPITGRRCEEVHHTEYDHYHAWACGGPNTAENLKTSCKGHNLYRAYQTYGKEKMDQYLNPKSTLVKQSDRAAIDCGNPN